MSRQPAQRDLLEALRRQSEVLRADELAASDRIGTRNVEAELAAVAARRAAEAARTAAFAALDAANAAVAAAGAAASSVTAATEAVAAAVAATAAANAAIASANARIAALARSTVATAVASGRVDPRTDGGWQLIGLALGGPWGGLLAVARVFVPVAREAATEKRQHFQLRINGGVVAERTVGELPRPAVFAHAAALPAGDQTFEVWHRGEPNGFVNVYPRALSVTLMAG